MLDRGAEMARPVSLGFRRWLTGSPMHANSAHHFISEFDRVSGAIHYELTIGRGDGNHAEVSFAQAAVQVHLRHGTDHFA